MSFQPQLLSSGRADALWPRLQLWSISPNTTATHFFTCPSKTGILEWTNDVQICTIPFQDIPRYFKCVQLCTERLGTSMARRICFLATSCMNFPKAFCEQGQLFCGHCRQNVDRSVPEYYVEVKAHGPCARPHDEWANIDQRPFSRFRSNGGAECSFQPLCSL